MPAMRLFLKRFLHHFVCNGAWSYPHTVTCDYELCGNWCRNVLNRPGHHLYDERDDSLQEIID